MNQQNDFNGKVLNVKLDNIADTNKGIKESIQLMHTDLLKAMNKMSSTNAQLLQKICLNQQNSERYFDLHDKKTDSIKSKLNVNIYLLIPVIAGLITIIIGILTIK